MLSQRARYALHALTYLARRHGAPPVAIAEIAEATTAPRKFLEAILLELKRSHILASSRGRSGGYILARPPEAISFADVIRVLDGPLALAPCASKMAYRPCATCPSVEDCEIRPAMVASRDAVAAILENWTLARAATGQAPPTAS